MRERTKPIVSCFNFTEQLGGLDRPLKRLLSRASRTGASPSTRIKVGSVIVREHQGRLHEVVVTPDGFLWAERRTPACRRSRGRSRAPAGKGPGSLACGAGRGSAAVSVRVAKERCFSQSQPAASHQRGDSGKPRRLKEEATGSHCEIGPMFRISSVGKWVNLTSLLALSRILVTSRFDAKSGASGNQSIQSAPPKKDLLRSCPVNWRPRAPVEMWSRPCSQSPLRSLRPPEATSNPSTQIDDVAACISAAPAHIV